VPFAIVAAWTRVIRWAAAALLASGAVLQTALTPRSPEDAVLPPLALAGSILFGAGWALVGARLMRTGIPDGRSTQPMSETAEREGELVDQADRDAAR
jgi:hypothetical protein